MRSGKYYAAVIRDGRKIDVHRKIVEEALGRPLLRTEVVHHKNGNRNDNRPENLELMTLSEHSRLHQKGSSMSDAAKQKLSEANKGLPKVWLRSLTPEQVQEVYKMRAEGQTVRGIADHFNISHSSITGILNGRIYADLKQDAYFPRHGQSVMKEDR